MSDTPVPVSAQSALANEQEGVATTSVPNADLAKHVATGLVALAAAGLTVFPEHTVAFKVCAAIVGLGAAFGIRSQGVGK